MYCVGDPSVPPGELDLHGPDDDLIATMQDAHEGIPELYADYKSQIRFTVLHYGHNHTGLRGGELE
jgi:hypothetical protein